MVLFFPKIIDHVEYLTQQPQRERAKWSWVLAGLSGPCVFLSSRPPAPGCGATCHHPPWPHSIWPHHTSPARFSGCLGHSSPCTWRSNSAVFPASHASACAAHPPGYTLPCWSAKNSFYLQCSSSSTSSRKPLPTKPSWRHEWLLGPLCASPTSLMTADTGKYLKASYGPSSLLLLSGIIILLLQNSMRLNCLPEVMQL